MVIRKTYAHVFKFAIDLGWVLLKLRSLISPLRETFELEKVQVIYFHSRSYLLGVSAAQLLSLYLIIGEWMAAE